MALTGSCLCGGIRFRIDDGAPPLQPIQVCHCTQCRKAQGGPFATNIPVDAAAFTLQDEEGLLRGYESSPGKERLFCSRCGSPVLSRRTALPGLVRVRAGLIDGPLPVRPGWHFHVGSKADWWTIGDDLPRFEEAPPKR